MVSQIAPAVRVAIAETLGLQPGEVTIGQIVTGLKMIGFDYVFGEWILRGLCLGPWLPPHTEGLRRLRRCSLYACPKKLARCSRIPPLSDMPAPLEPTDTLFGADLTIMEEGTELLHRLTHHLDGHPDQEEPMPMFTSCCPGACALLCLCMCTPLCVWCGGGGMAQAYAM